MNEKRLIFVLFLFWIFFYLLFPGTYSEEAFYSSDEAFYFRLTQSLVDNTSLEIEPYLGYDHSKYMPGQSVAGIPFYALSKFILFLFPNYGAPGHLILVFVHLTNILIGALICVLFFKFGRDLGYGIEASIGGSLVLGMTTTFLPYSRQYFADPLVALFILLSVRYLYLSIKGKTGNAAWGGVFFGCAVLTKIDTALLLIPLGMALLYVKKDLLKRYIHFITGLVPLSILILIYNHLNYGSAFNPGYERQEFASPFFSGIYGLLFSPSRGLFLFSPSVIMFFLGWRKFREKFPALFFICIVVIISRIAVLAKWFSWQGGWCWGPRLLLTIIPLMTLPAFEIFETWKEQKGAIRITTLSLLIAGFFIQIIGTLVSPNKFNNDIYGMMPSGMNEFLYIPQLSTIKGNLFLLFQGKTDWGWMSFIRSHGFIGIILFIINISAALFLGGMLLRNMGAKRKGWFSEFFPERRICGSILGFLFTIYIISDTILQSQGLYPFLQYAYIEEIVLQKSSASPRKYTGYLYAPTEGDYLFYLKVRGMYDISLDRKSLMQRKEDQPQHWEFARINLAKGYHFMQIEYTPSANSDLALMHLYWTIPDGAEYKSVIGPMYLFREPPGAFRKILLGFVRFRSWIALLIILGFILKRHIVKKNTEDSY
ncbi:glycosyltransferase family 39 protein [Candidatus Sumerlaeota bacterium]|nr:glycosyltransferase family 39 protein [Candidatus Sumerlaeota bacterium]